MQPPTTNAECLPLLPPLSILTTLCRGLASTGAVLVWVHLPLREETPSIVTSQRKGSSVFG